MSTVSRDRTAALRPRSVAWEAEYVEKYVLWNGPLAAEKSLRPSDESLVAAAVPAPSKPNLRSRSCRRGARPDAAGRANAHAVTP